MNKEEYIDDPDVSGFIDYFRGILNDSEAFEHSYKIRWKPWVSWVKVHDETPGYYNKDDENGKLVPYWGVNKLEDAFNSYYWPSVNGTHFYGNKLILDKLSVKITSCLEDADTNDLDLFSICVEILEWGDVYKGSVTWLLDKLNKGKLKRDLDKAIKILDSDTMEGIELFKDESELRIDSGLTKIYSLGSKKTIIYDSRVAAALGLIVTKYLRAESIKSVPSYLNFCVSKDNQGRRNPSMKDKEANSKYSFDSMQANMRRAESNKWANWILEEVAPYDRGMWGFSSQLEKMRAIEAALFMVGSSVKG